MGNNAGAIAACVAGVGAGAAAEASLAIGACNFLVIIPQAYAGCLAALGITGLVVGAAGAFFCIKAGASPQAPDDQTDSGGDTVEGRRRRRRASVVTRLLGGEVGRGGEGGSSHAEDFDRMQFIFDSFDRNGDGWLSHDDLPPWHEIQHDEPLKTVVTSMMSMSHVIDGDGDGRISGDELTAYRDKVKTDDGNLEVYFEAMDRNGDGKLTPNELTGSGAGECKLGMNDKPDSLKGSYETIRKLGCEQKGYVELPDLQDWARKQTRLCGYMGLGHYPAPNKRKEQEDEHCHGWVPPAPPAVTALA